MPEELKILRVTDHGEKYETPERFEVVIAKERFRTLVTTTVTKVKETDSVIETKTAESKDVIAAFGETLYLAALPEKQADLAAAVKASPAYAAAVKKIGDSLAAWELKVAPVDKTPKDMLLE